MSTDLPGKELFTRGKRDFSSKITKKRRGLTPPSFPKMPIDVYSDETNIGVYFHMLDSVLEWDFDDKDGYVNRTFLLDLAPQDEARVMDGRIAPHEGDWHEAFRVFKKHLRDHFDFTYYERPVQERYRERFVSHFTFLYGRDIYDFEANRFRIDEFLDEGEENFGGYDYMLLWRDYPRMGIDDRDQFAMYEDLPGGLDGLREMVERAHLRDVQVFIPYKPWDIMRKGQNHFTEEARIAKAIGADGARAVTRMGIRCIRNSSGQLSL